MNRMFQVIVVGGVALTSYACSGSVVPAQSGGTTSGSGSTSVGVGGFPSELGTCSPYCVTGAGGAVGAGGFPQEGPGPSTTSGLGGFPQEGPPATGGFPGTGGAAGSGGTGGFPHEGLPPPPPPPDGGSPPCFPEETAFSCPDAG